MPNPWSILLDFYCTDNFEFTQMIKYNLTVDDIEASDADVVVANFMMPELKKKPFICTSSLSSLELVEKLNAFFMILPVQNTKDKVFLETFLRWVRTSANFEEVPWLIKIQRAFADKVKIGSLTQNL